MKNLIYKISKGNEPKPQVPPPELPPESPPEVPPPLPQPPEPPQTPPPLPQPPVPPQGAFSFAKSANSTFTHTSCDGEALVKGLS